MVIVVYFVTCRYDGNKTIGHRLYREVYIFQSKRNSKGKSFSIPPAISSQWETLATTLEEFRKVAVSLNFLLVLDQELQFALSNSANGRRSSQVAKL